jgi:perosamine synthetase
MMIDGSQSTQPKDFIPLSVPEISGNEWAYVKECLDTGWVSSVGAYVDRFERELAAKVGTRYGVATVNGTAAIHVALKVAGVEAGDEVLVSTLTFIAPVNAIRYLGAVPVFMDAEPDYWQMDPAKVAAFLGDACQLQDGVLRNRSTGRRVKAIVPVDIVGHPVDLDPILELARRFGLAVVEDATESLGARYRGGMVGSRADIACISFNGNKVITTGGGGMVLTDREDWAKRCRYLTTQAKDDPIEFVHGEVGFNYRLTNVLAAIGCAQLERLDSFVARKRQLAQRYATALGGVPGLLPMGEAPWAQSIYWMYTVLVEPERFGMDSRALIRSLGARNIQARPLWQPMHRSPAHQDCPSAPCPVADRLASTGVSLPCSVGLTSSQQDAVIAHVLEAAAGGAGR